MMLFSIMVDMLAFLTSRAKDMECLFYKMWLIILFMDHDLEKVANLTLVLSVFKQKFGLEISYSRIQLYCIPV
jgi:hypothetical protein